MAINLQKGQRESLNAQKFIIGLGWDTNSYSTGVDFDLDASVFILGENKKILSDKHFVFYNNLNSPNDAVVHSGDNLTGDGDGDDEQVIVDLSKIDANATEICVVITIHDAENRKQNFLSRNCCRIWENLQAKWRMEIRGCRCRNERWSSRLFNKV